MCTYVHIPFKQFVGAGYDAFVVFFSYLFACTSKCVGLICTKVKLKVKYYLATYFIDLVGVNNNKNCSCVLLYISKSRLKSSSTMNMAFKHVLHGVLNDSLC